jgi:hypothetical protein
MDLKEMLVLMENREFKDQLALQEPPEIWVQEDLMDIREFQVI